jgi:hypothetical protein
MNKQYFYGLSGLLAGFALLIFVLCFYFRISTDDYYYITEVERIGVLKIITSTYLKWSGRFAASAVMNSFFKILKGQSSSFFIIPLSTIVVLLLGIHKTISVILCLCKIELSLLHRWVLSACFLFLLFFLSFDIGETWFWCSSIGCYLFSIIAFIWGFYFILQPVTNFFTYLGITGCFLFIGGATEVYSPVFLLILAGILLYYFQQFRSHSQAGQFMQNTIQRKLVVAFVALSVAFIILLVAPGNYMRDQLFPQHRFFFSFYVTAKSFVKFFFLYLPFHLQFILAFCVVFLLIGETCKSEKLVGWQLPFRPFLKKITVIFIFLLALFFYMIAYIMSETGPARIWFLASFLFAVYSCSISFYAGYCSLFSFKQLRLIKGASLFTTGIILSYSFVSQVSVAKNYAKKYDEREQQLLTWKQEIKKDTLLSIPALPKPGMLYAAEISTDSGHYTNQHLRMIYKLNFHVVKN